MSADSVTTSADTLTPPCPLCGGDSQMQFTKSAYRYFKCHCGFVFIWPRPSQQKLQEMYRDYGEHYWITQRMVNFAFSPTKSWREIQFVGRFASRGTLLDVGCSTGSFVKAARERGFDAEGVDISAPAVRFGQDMGLPLYVLDILRESPRELYDLVTMWATLEHLPDPRQYLRRARDLLKPGGLLFVSVPNYAGITQTLLGKRDRYVGRDHLNYFQPRVLRQGLKAEGFSFKGSTTYAFNPIVILRDFRNRGEEGKEGLTTEDMQSDQAATLRLKHSPLLQVQRAIERILNLFSAGDVIAMCAEASHLWSGPVH